MAGMPSRDALQPTAVEAAPAPPRQRHPRRVPVETVAALCPYLRADGGWRSARPMPDHRCTAVTPAAAVSSGTQRALCLRDKHTSCDAFQAATAQRQSDLTLSGIDPGRISGSRIGRAARSAPVALDRPGRVAASAKLAAFSRSATGAGLAIAAVLALSAVVLARLPAGDAASEPPAAGAFVASPRTDAQSVLPATATPPPTTPRPSPSPTPSATPSAAPSVYVVQAGDTLSAIAARFDTTIAVLVELNGIEDAAHLQIGQELRLP
jgi:LysM repeat protein